MANFRKDTQVYGPALHDKTVFEVPMIANKNGEVVTTENPFPVTITQAIGYSNRSTSCTNSFAVILFCGSSW